MNKLHLHLHSLYITLLCVVSGNHKSNCDEAGGSYATLCRGIQFKTVENAFVESVMRRLRLVFMTVQPVQSKLEHYVWTVHI